MCFSSIKTLILISEVEIASMLIAFLANVFFGGYDKIFETKCKKYGIPFVQRTKKSSNSEKASEIYNFLSEQNFDYLLQVNACMPLLRVETIIKFLNKCKKIKKPAFGVYEVNNYFMSNRDKPYNFNSRVL